MFGAKGVWCKISGCMCPVCFLGFQAHLVFKHDSARSTLTELAVLVELERKVGNRDLDQPGVSQ